MKHTVTDDSGRDIDAARASFSRAARVIRIDGRARLVLAAAFVLPGALGGLSSRVDDPSALAGPGGGGKGGGGGGGGGAKGGAKSGKPPPPKGKPPPSKGGEKQPPP